MRSRWRSAVRVLSASRASFGDIGGHQCAAAPARSLEERTGVAYRRGCVGEAVEKMRVDRKEAAEGRVTVWRRRQVGCRGRVRQICFSTEIVKVRSVGPILSQPLDDYILFMFMLYD